MQSKSFVKKIKTFLHFFALCFEISAIVLSYERNMNFFLKMFKSTRALEVLFTK